MDNKAVIQELELVKQEISIVKEMLQELLVLSKKTSDHVDFVEDVYTSVRKPFEYLCGRKVMLPIIDAKPALT